MILSSITDTIWQTTRAKTIRSIFKITVHIESVKDKT